MMKIKNMLENRIIVAVFLMCCFSGSLFAAPKVELEVELDNAGNAVALRMISNNEKCSNAEPECVLISKGSSPNMFFDLDDACETGAKEYKLTAMRISMTHKVWPTCAAPLPDDVAYDFLADPHDGFINFRERGNYVRDDRIKLRNKNRTATDVHYEIIASHCTDAAKPDIKYDPRIRNLGQ